MKIEKRVSEGRSGSAIPGRNRHLVETGSLRLTAETDSMYSFFVKENSQIYTGESLVPPADHLIVKLGERLAKGIDFDSEDSGIVTLASVNLKESRVDIFKSHSCNRPLYYLNNESMFFSSSHLQRFTDNGLRIELDQRALPEFYVYRFIMPPRTLFEDIYYLPGGWCLTVDLNEGKPQLENRWRIDRSSQFDNLEGAVEKTAHFLRGSLGFLRESGQKAILLLSGGLDSTILGAACRESGLGKESISSGFHRITGDNGESDYARSAAEALDLRHSIYDIDEETYLCGLVDSINVTAEPIHHLQSAVLGQLFCRGLGPEWKCLINGEGADSLFCNTMHYDYWIRRSLLKMTGNPVSKVAMRALSTLPSPVGDRFRYYTLDHSDDHLSERHFIWDLGAYGDPDWVAGRFDVGKEEIIRNRMSFLDNFRNWSILDKITVLSFCGEADETMKIWGRLAEAAGKKMIYPFTVSGLIRFALSLPWGMKAEEPKYLLKKVAIEMGIPGEIINRPKKSFGFPIRFWAPPGALFQPLVDMAGEIFDRKDLQELQSPESSKAMILWGIINLYIWHKLFVDRIDASDLKSEILDRRKRSKKSPV
jgi:asparagine synthetase B (glutamine-hydrolysing)